MNHVVSWVSQQEEFLIKDISFDLSYVISTYLILLASILAYKTLNFKRIVFLLVSILMLQSVFINTKQNNQSEAFIIFHKSRFTVFGKKENTNLTIWHNLDSNSVKTQKMISDYKIGNFIKSIRYDTISNVYNTRTKRLLIIDSLAVYQVSFKPDYVLLRHSPKINLKRLIDSLKPELIIADGSNYKSYIKRWKATCIKEKLPFHETYEKGALILQ
jgi:competence protein ComEC